MSASIFANVEMAPRDPILGLTEAFKEDDRAEKVNLGVGVYQDDDGRIPLLECVHKAEEERAQAGLPRGYQPIEGAAAYNAAVQGLLFGDRAEVIRSARVITFETLGGTGALKVGADYLKNLFPEAGLYISDPSWENHRGVFGAAGFDVNTYPYFDPETRGVRFDAMKQTLSQLPANSIVVLHACCHNPTGADLSEAQWGEIVETCRAAKLIPFIDIAYQGFGDDPVKDTAAVRMFADSGMQFVVASSFSKNFSLYGERVGALSIIAENQDEAARVLSQVKRVIRTNYSNPPTHGGAIVATVLNSPELRKLWESELVTMRDRIRTMRSSLLESLNAEGVTQDFSFITRQRGMFSFTGLSPEQVERLRDEFGIYAVKSGRICLAALNSNNVGYVAKAIAAVTQ
ncbi:MAG TPA: amino acid aminotransferase [Azoarcus sp.]|nr:amino acid aminotransferase [Azoarcus sp.]